MSDELQKMLDSVHDGITTFDFEGKETPCIVIDEEKYGLIRAKIEGQPFSVNTDLINVEVYGTRFNFKNYPEDSSSDIVLVEGSIGLYSNYSNKITRLKPGVKGSFNKSDYSITQDQINTSIYTSWINGQVVFRNESFENILIKLERIYNVEIINNSNRFNETFNAKIDIEKESINEVLSYFNKIYNIEYKTHKNKIIII